MNQLKLRRYFPLFLLLALVLIVAVVPVSAVTKHHVNVQILALNDFHGNLQPPSGSSGRVIIVDNPSPIPDVTVDAGGVEYLSTHVAALRATNPNTVFVSAGDMIGASPLLSALFHDEPSVEAFNHMGLDFNAVGNHEFDEGTTELLRMQNGGSHPVDGDLDGDGFGGADFQFLSANVVVNETGKTLFPAYTIKTYQGVRVAFIGLTLEGTPSIVTPAGVAGLTFLDEVESVNAVVADLKKRNIESFVVLIHEGGFSDGGPNDCGSGLTGPLATIVPGLDDAVDVVIAGHVNDEFICEVDGKLVTMADTAGRLFTDIDVTLDRQTKDMTVVAVNNVPNLQAADDDPEVQALIDKYDELSAPLANTVIGSITADINRVDDAEGESPLGQVIADAQLAATAPAGFCEAVVAFMNKGGVRDELDFAASGNEGDGNVTFGEAFMVQPFGNSLVTMTLTGAQIDAVLEQQFQGAVSALDVSNGFTYSLSASAAPGSKVPNIQINGTPVTDTGTYRVTVNSFLADGGDNYPVLAQGTDRLGGEVDLDALVAYFEDNSPVAPGPQNRVTPLP